MSEDVDTGRYCGDEYKCKDCGELHMFPEDDE